MHNFGTALLTLLAGILVWAGLTMPGEHIGWGFEDFIRIPLAAVVLAVLALLLPRRPLRVVAVVFGILLGAMVLLSGLNIGFLATLSRQFDIVDDWNYLRAGVDVIGDLAGALWATLAVIGAIIFSIAVFIVVPLASLRVCGAISRHRRRGISVVAVLAVAWIVLAGAGVGWPHHRWSAAAASIRTSKLAWQTADSIPKDLADRARFARKIHSDPDAGTPAKQLVAGLHGKDVLLVFVESYGRVGLDDPQLAPTVRKALATSDHKLNTAGFSARSAWLTSPTFGAGSWLAHSTVESGLWVNSQRRYDQLTATKRRTLVRTFGQAGWRTVFDVPSTDRPWPEGKPFYGFDKLYTAENVGYHGATYGYATMPDQYTLHTFDQRELQPKHRKPVMAEIDLLSSHYPWTPPPPLLPPSSVGNGSKFTGPKASPHSGAGFRKMYATDIAYTMRALTSFVRHSNDPNLVVLAMGDHQPNSSVTKPGASHQVPAMLIAHNRHVLHQVAGWGWQPGLKPASDAPVRRMSTLRNRIFTTFGKS
jgi:hypothetical protein